MESLRRVVSKMHDALVRTGIISAATPATPAAPPVPRPVTRPAGGLSPSADLPTAVLRDEDLPGRVSAIVLECQKPRKVNVFEEIAEQYEPPEWTQYWGGYDPHDSTKLQTIFEIFLTFFSNVS